MSFGVVSVSLIGAGLLCNSISLDKSKKTLDKISNEKIYNFPSDINSIKKPDSIIKIEPGLLKLYLNKKIGYVAINHIIQNPKITYRNVYNSLSDKYELQKIINNEEIKINIGKQILFPNVHTQLVLDPKLLCDKKINILFDNIYYIKTSTDNLIDRYENIIRCNIPSFKSDIPIKYNNTKMLEIEENLLKNDSNLYLMVSPNINNNKLNINTIGCDEKSILEHKYRNDIQCAKSMDDLSGSLIIGGVIIGLLGIFSK